MNSIKTMNEKVKKPICCEDEVKDFASKFLSHKRCTAKKEYKYASKVMGKYLNDYVVDKCIFKDVMNDGNINKPFNARKYYIICSNLKRSIDKHNSKNSLPPIQSFPITKSSTTGTAPTKSPNDIPTSSSAPTPTLDRGERYFMRKRIPVTSLKGITAINLKIGDDDDVVIDPRKLPKKSYNQMFIDDVIEKSSPYKLPFGSLTMKQKNLRTNELVKAVLASCINRKELKKDGKTYLESNSDLAVDLLNLLDAMKTKIQKKLKVDLNALQDSPIVPVENDAEGLITTLDKDNSTHKLAIALLCGSSETGYERLRHSVESFTTLPSYHILTKDRPAIFPLNFQVATHSNAEEGTTIPSIEGITVTNDESRSEADIHELVLRQSSLNTASIYGAVVEGGYSHHIDLLVSNHHKNGRMIDSESKVIVLDSIDGAEHTRTNKSVKSVISFSSSLFTPEWILNNSVTAGSSLNVLTWQQVQATEDLPIMLQTTEEYFKVKESLRNDHDKYSNFSFYDLHDGKMLYLLTQHSLWNRKHHPFLLCKCKRGNGVLNNSTHMCSIIDDDDQVKLYEKSLKRYKDKINDSSNNYSKKEHLEWADKNNYGCTHFGIHPDLLPRSTIRFDTFHLKCSITRKLMSYLRLFLLDQAPTINETYCVAVLSKFWKQYHIWIWENKKNFSSFMGNELALFTANIKDTNEFLASNLIPTNKVLNIQKALGLWKDIFHFLSITHLNDISDVQYTNMLQVFKSNVVEFYYSGSNTFLSSSDDKVGDDETFYLHTLRYYMPKIAEETYNEHKIGIGIFNMQGFERRNKESKNCMKRFSNNKGNVVVNNIKRVYDIFDHKLNAF